VFNTEDKFIWMTTYPGTTDPSHCKDGLSSPPSGTGGAATGPELGSGGAGVKVIPYPGDPATTWFSPTSSQLSSLIHDAAYKPVGQWISDQTSTRPDDPPGVQSIGFVPTGYSDPACTPNGPWVWTRDAITPGINYVVINFNDGAAQPTNSSVGKQGNFNWVFLVGQFQYQYYWYN
jgi:hypothetical protein